MKTIHHKPLGAPFFYWGATALGVLLFIADRLSKMIALQFWGQGIVFNDVVGAGTAKEIIPGLLEFSVVPNAHLVWIGVFPIWIVVGIIFLVLLLLLRLLIDAWRTHHRLAVYGYAILFAGAISNMIDRVLYGAVIDFIRIPFSVFNVSDVLIVIGALIVCLDIWFFGLYRETKDVFSQFEE